MGMAASQARLLTLTARIHDVEYHAQALQNAKLQLATQSDEVYREYLNALDATTLTVTNSNGDKSVANFNNLCGINAINSTNNSQYFIYDKRGRVVVQPDIKDGYENFKAQIGKSDAYLFAMYMTGLNDNEGHKLMGKIGTEDAFANELYESEYGIRSNFDASIQKNDTIINLYNEMVKIMQDNGIMQEDDTYITSEMENQLKTDFPDEYKDYTKAKTNYERAMYSAYAANIYCEAAGVEETFEEYDTDEYKDDFQYYVNVFNEIENAGGCVSIDDFNGINDIGNAATDSDWLQSMIQSGNMTICLVKYDSKGKEAGTSDGVSSSTYLEYTTTSSIDKSALAKAEAKYEHDSKLIDQKDKRYDLEISKLETERKALTTEYESVKKVIQENIDRTFGIFS